MYYTGQGAYATHNGFRFDKDNRIFQVPNTSVLSLITSGVFRRATEDEIKEIDPFYRDEIKEIDPFYSP